MNSADTLQFRLPRRPRQAHKGDFGRVLILAGSEGYTGAPVLAARAALRTGAGLVFLGVPRDIYPIVAVKCDEAMPFPLPEDHRAILDRAIGCDAVLIGPGLGRRSETEQLVLELLEELEVPVVLDADGINALAGHIDVLDGRRAPTVLTPHEGEFARVGELASGREKAAASFAADRGVTLVLKGHHTLIAAPDGRLAVNPTGNCGMAKGGSGDVLSGMILSLLGMGLDAFSAACCGVYLHGLAGDIAARELTEYAMTPTDMVERIPCAYKEILQADLG